MEETLGVFIIRLAEINELSILSSFLFSNGGEGMEIIFHDLLVLAMWRRTILSHKKRRVESSQGCVWLVPFRWNFKIEVEEISQWILVDLLLSVDIFFSI